jgi:hypothetical protein
MEPLILLAERRLIAKERSFIISLDSLGFASRRFVTNARRFLSDSFVKHNEVSSGFWRTDLRT